MNTYLPNIDFVFFDHSSISSNNSLTYWNRFCTGTYYVLSLYLTYIVLRISEGDYNISMVITAFGRRDTRLYLGFVDHKLNSNILYSMTVSTEIMCAQ